MRVYCGANAMRSVSVPSAETDLYPAGAINAGTVHPVDVHLIPGVRAVLVGVPVLSMIPTFTLAPLQRAIRYAVGP